MIVINKRLRDHFLVVFFLFTSFGLIIFLGTDPWAKKALRFILLELIIAMLSAAETYLQKKYILR